MVEVDFGGWWECDGLDSEGVEGLVVFEKLGFVGRDEDVWVKNLVG